VFFLALAAAAPLHAQQPANPKPARPNISFTRPLELVKLTGPIFWPLLACSLITITFGLERFIALRRRRVIPGSFLRKFRKRLEAGEFHRESAMEACRGNGSPIAMIFLAAVRLWGLPTVELQKAVADAGQMQVLQLRRNLRILQAVGNISTLLGLLGTVLGMIHSFNNVTELRGIQRGEELSHGIAEALVATAFGLAVAIPSLCLYTFFSGRVERLVVDMDEQASDLIDFISAEALAGPRATAGVPPRRVEPAPRSSAGFGR
jgi:biopolymer transport protein ExbB